MYKIKANNVCLFNLNFLTAQNLFWETHFISCCRGVFRLFSWRIRRVVIQKLVLMRARGSVAFPSARNYTFKPCVMHIERLIKVTDASGNYSHSNQTKPNQNTSCGRQPARGPSRTPFTPIIILWILIFLHTYICMLIFLVSDFSAN